MKNATKKEKKVVAPKVAKKVLAKKKPVAKKKSSAKKVVVQKKVEMISYAIKMVIPTGAYANIQPEIVVKAGDMETAHAFIAPHINKLWKEYYMVSERVNNPAPTAPKVDTTHKPAPKTAETAPEAPKLPVDENNKVNVATVVPPAPASAVALDKASKAISSCMSLEALNLISTQVEKSVKLTDDNKVVLRALVVEKTKDFNAKQ